MLSDKVAGEREAVEAFRQIAGLDHINVIDPADIIAAVRDVDIAKKQWANWVQNRYMM
jgi:hypothetical protein